MQGLLASGNYLGFPAMPANYVNVSTKYTRNDLWNFYTKVCNTSVSFEKEKFAKSEYSPSESVRKKICLTLLITVEYCKFRAWSCAKVVQSWRSPKMLQSNPSFVWTGFEKAETGLPKSGEPTNLRSLPLGPSKQSCLCSCLCLCLCHRFDVSL